jgi:hypothetical protein
MSYMLIIYNSDKDVDHKEVDTIEQAREAAQVVVNERMEAFGEDHEALVRYGFIDAEDKALSLSDEGGVIFMQDGWKIEVINNRMES